MQSMLKDLFHQVSMLSGVMGVRRKWREMMRTCTNQRKVCKRCHLRI